MDHMPAPRDSFGYPDVPLLSLENYDGKDFFTYSDRQGWGPRTVGEWYDIFEQGPSELHEFLQRWLYFGTIEAMFGQNIDIRRDFTHWKQGKPYLTTRRLESFARRAASSRLSPSVNMVLFRANALHDKLRTASAFREDRPQNAVSLLRVQSIEQFILHGKSAFEQNPLISISTTLLLHFLTSLLFSAEPYTRLEKISHAHANEFSRKPWRTPSWNLLRKYGWCPSQLAMISHRFGTAGMLYMSCLTRPNPLLSHDAIRVRRLDQVTSSSIPVDGREPCSRYMCSRRLLTDATYTTKHNQGCHGCPDVIADNVRLRDVLLCGSFPLIISIDLDDENPQIEFLPWEPNCSFVAISHVWSDGLGNVAQNALPRCQLQRLSKLVRNLPNPAEDVALFWVDTLCVPPDAADDPIAQNKAIASMRAVYEHSTATLVLDKWLLETQSWGMTDLELLMRMFSCEWNRRLWTFQEGVLPKTLFFQFEDKALDLDKLATRFEKWEDDCERMMLGDAVLKQYYALRKLIKTESSEGAKLGLIGTALSNRTTSVASDEAICLSTLMNFDMEDIVSSHPEDRMMKFWAMTNQVPWSILIDDGQHIKVPGFGWAPQSLLMNKTRNLSAMPHNFSDTYNDCVRVESGLETRGKGLLVSCQTASIGGPFYVYDTVYKVWHYINISLDTDVPTLESYLQTDPDEHQRIDDPKRITPHRIHSGCSRILLLGLDQYLSSLKHAAGAGSSRAGERLHQFISNNTYNFSHAIMIVLEGRDMPRKVVYGTKVGTAVCTLLNLNDPEIAARLPELETHYREVCASQNSSIDDFENAPVVRDQRRQGNLYLTVGRWTQKNKFCIL